MAQSPDWRQLLEAGMQLTAMTRAEAQRRAQRLVREGQLAQERVQGFVEDLLDASRKRADELAEVVRREVQRQMESFGLATKDDLARLEQRLRGKASKAGAKAAAARNRAGSGAAKPGGARKKSAAKKAGKSAAAMQSSSKR